VSKSDIHQSGREKFNKTKVTLSSSNLCGLIYTSSQASQGSPRMSCRFLRCYFLIRRVLALLLPVTFSDGVMASVATTLWAYCHPSHSPLLRDKLATFPRQYRKTRREIETLNLVQPYTATISRVSGCGREERKLGWHTPGLRARATEWLRQPITLEKGSVRVGLEAGRVGKRLSTLMHRRFE